MKDTTKLLQYKKYVAILLAFIAALFMILGIYNVITVNASVLIQYEDKIYQSIDETIDYSDNKVIVVLDKNISGINKNHDSSLFGTFDKLQINELTARKNKSNKGDNFRQIYEIILAQHSKENVKAAIRELESIPGILAAEPDYYYETSTIKTSNDTYYNSQWALNGKSGMNAPLAWGITTGTSSVRVGIIDTGIANHPDLDNNLISGKDFSNNDAVTNDDTSGHGTSVAGIIGAVSNNSKGVAGINWNVSLVPLQAEDLTYPGFISVSAAVDAINYATETYWTNERIDILNYSVAGFGSRTSILSAVQNYPGLFVWSAGNNGAVIDNANSYNLDNLISVGAIDSNSNRSVWNSVESSAYGNSVNIFAPGTDVRTTAINNSYCNFSGTSAAAPNVAGAAALLLSYDSTLTAAELKNIILDSADSITIEGRSAKRLDLGSALWRLKYPDKIELQNIGYYAIGGGCNGNTAGWNIEVSNNSNSTMRVIYNTKMCFEDDAKNWTGLTDIDYFELQAGQSKVVNVETNVFATHIAFSYIVNGKRYVTYANELDSNNNMLNPNLSNVTYSNNSTINLVGKNGGTWIIDVKNTFNEKRTLAYNTKMCYTDDAKNWTGLSDVNDDTVLYPSETTTIRIVENAFADAIAVSLVDINENWRYVYYANNLNADCTMTVGTNSMSSTQQSGGNCVSAGTLVTLSDGNQVPVESLTGDEMLLVWNMYTGSFDSAPILCIDSDPLRMYDVIQLSFSDGTVVNVISEHGFFDVDLNKYIYLDENAADYIGHCFLKQGVNGMVQVTLEDVTITQESTTAYSPVTYGHLCYFVNGMLSMPGGIDGLFNIFEVDPETMMYDAVAMAVDIEKYGLYTYEELNALVPLPEVMFDAVYGQYLKVAVGKGITNLTAIEKMIESYKWLF